MKRPSASPGRHSLVLASLREQMGVLHGNFLACLAVLRGWKSPHALPGWSLASDNVKGESCVR